MTANERDHASSIQPLMPMAVCGQCGSINLVEARPGVTDRVVRLVTARRPFLCRRCGWRARRSWTANDLKRRSEFPAPSPQPDPLLSVLDGDFDVEKRGPTRGQAQDSSPATERFDFGKIGFADESHTRLESSSLAHGSPVAGRRRTVRRHRGKSSRREILATIAATAFVLFFIALFALAGSCVGGGDA